VNEDAGGGGGARRRRRRRTGWPRRWLVPDRTDFVRHAFFLHGAATTDLSAATPVFAFLDSFRLPRQNTPAGLRNVCVCPGIGAGEVAAQLIFFSSFESLDSASPRKRFSSFQAKTPGQVELPAALTLCRQDGQSPSFGAKPLAEFAARLAQFLRCWGGHENHERGALSSRFSAI